jgi:hypothetical protein
MGLQAENWTAPQASVKLGDRLLLISDSGECEGEVVALTSSSLAPSPFRPNLNLPPPNFESTGRSCNYTVNRPGLCLSAGAEAEAADPIP